jgi:probable F420-dependent oxidoreductase
MRLGSTGVWSGLIRRGERSAALAACAELEQLGYETIWMPGGGSVDLLDRILGILGATQEVVVATGIVSVWTHPPRDIAREHREITTRHPGRYLLGLGISHEDSVTAAGIKYEKPLRKLAAYLDELDQAPTPVPVDERILASLGPRSLALARRRSLGTHPYFVPVEHTRIAREALGPDKIVATELMAVVETDPRRARAIARPTLRRYLHLPNYTNSLLRLGFSESDFAGDGSDRLVDAIVAHGSPEAIMQRVREHHSAGADHVCIQVLTDTPEDLDAAMHGWRQLAPQLVRN